MKVGKDIYRWILITGGIFIFLGCSSVNRSTTPTTTTAGQNVSPAEAPAKGSFKRVTLVEQTTRPNELAVADDGRVFFIEREGAVRVWNPADKSTRTIGFIPTNAVHTSGLMGLALDPRFSENGWVYLYFAPHDKTKNLLCRFTIRKNRLVPESRKVLLEVSANRQVDGGHSAGSLAFGPEGNLYLSTGDNTSPRATGFAPLDERPGREIWDAQRSSANTFDLRGKILRIRPLPDGSYELPEGNLFPYGAQGRPEIYVMGNRNPFRIAVDPKNGWLYWGEVGPDAGSAKETRGPAGHDEFNQARRAGNYGWPYFVGDNKPYHRYDFAAEQSGDAFDPKRPVNASVNNTGARVLPPAQPAMIWYPYSESKEFPTLGSGGRSAMAGPLYRYNGQTARPEALPAYYDGTLFIYDFMRGWIKNVRLDQQGNLQAVEPFLPEMEFLRPFDLEVGPKGALYLIEWGSSYEGWYNDQARIVRLEYRGGADHRLADGKKKKPSAESQPELAIEWPTEGTIVDLDKPIKYQIDLPRAADKAAEAQKVQVQAWLGHDSHAHPQDKKVGLKGQVHLRPDESHLYLEDHFVRLEATYAPSSSPSQTVREKVMLQPQHLEVEHADQTKNISRTFVGDNEKGNVLRMRRNVRTFVEVKNGSYLSYKPVDLKGVTTVTVRVLPLQGGTLEIRSDRPNGSVLARQRIEKKEKHAGKGGASRSEPGWKQVTLPIEDPGGPHKLFFVFKGAGDQPLMQLDWAEFGK